MTSVKEIKTIARNWVDENIENFTGTIGVYFTGSLSHMEDDEEFPFFSDIDIRIAVEDTSIFKKKRNKEEYKGFIVEWILIDKSILKSVDTILLDPYKAQHFIKNSILLDKDDFLGQFQGKVQSKYFDPNYVKKRCIKWLFNLQNELKKNQRGVICKYMAEIIILANQEYITVRKLLVVTYEILQAQNRLDLQEFLLEILGANKFTKSEVLQDLDNLIQAFDFAVTLDKKTATFGDFNMHAYVRPYIFHGALDMIERDHHREAVWWILVMYNIVITAIMNAQDHSSKNLFITHYKDFLNRLGHHQNYQNIFVNRLAPKSILQEICLYLQQTINLSCTVRT